MERVKFYESGKWADRPCDPIIEVSKGQVLEVSDSLAKVVVDAGKGERVSSIVVNESNSEPAVEKKGPGRPKKEKPNVTDKESAESE